MRMRLQGSANPWGPAFVNFVTAVANHFCLTLSRAFSQPGACGVPTSDKLREMHTSRGRCEKVLNFAYMFNGSPLVQLRFLLSHYKKNFAVLLF